MHPLDCRLSPPWDPRFPAAFPPPGARTGLYARSLSRRELLAVAAKGRQARTVLVLDACFSDRTSRGEPLVRGLQPLVPLAKAASLPRGVLVLTAAGADQFAGPLPGADRPAFRYLVAGALRGWGDGDRDGAVTAAEAVGYATDALRAVVRDRSQTPELLGAGPRGPHPQGEGGGAGSLRGGARPGERGAVPAGVSRRCAPHARCAPLNTL